MREVEHTSAPKLIATFPALCVKNGWRIRRDCLPRGTRNSREFWRRLNILTGRDKPAAWFGGRGDVFGREGDQIRPARLNRVTDGLSKTLLVSEQAAAPTRYSGYGTSSPRVPHSELPWCTSYFSAEWPMQFDSPKVSLLNSPSATEGAPLNWDNCEGLYSFHRGVNAAHCDGSVRFLAEGIESSVLISSLTRSAAD